MNDFRFLNLLKKKLDLYRSESEKFYNILFNYWNANYEWGQEHLAGADCSGVIAGTLAFMGYPIRETAEGFKNKFFTTETDYVFDPRKVKALFFNAKEDYKTPSGTRKKGRAKHVALLAGNGVVFNATVPQAKFETLETIKARYPDSNMIIRELDWAKVKKNEIKYQFDSEFD